MVVVFVCKLNKNVAIIVIVSVVLLVVVITIGVVVLIVIVVIVVVIVINYCHYHTCVRSKLKAQLAKCVTAQTVFYEISPVDECLQSANAGLNSNVTGQAYRRRPAKKIYTNAAFLIDSYVMQKLL